MKQCGKVALVLLAAVALLGCAAEPPTRDPAFNDPFEASNRQWHAFNKTLGGAVTGDGGGGETETARILRQGATNFADNLGGPADVLNNLLQVRIENAGHNTFRFLINSTLGVAGLFDPARAIGLSKRTTDFGETLHVWGVGEGAYLEMPVLGPSTMRDAIGDIVDTAINPLRQVSGVTGNRTITAANAAREAATVSGASGLISEILTNSADSYAQLRLVYLQNRRFELERNARGAGAIVQPAAPAQETATPAATDPFADPYADPYSVEVPPPQQTAPPIESDSYAADPYDDPYAF